MLPTAIEISGFRSFGKQPALINSLRKLNFFVGQNNSSKSNVLRAITMLSGMRGADTKLSPRPSDFDSGIENICVFLHFPNRLLKQTFIRHGGRNDAQLEEIEESSSFAIPFTVNRNNDVTITDEQLDHFVASTSIPATCPSRNIP